MAEKIIKLTTDEIVQLQNLYRDKKKGAITGIIIVAAFLLLFTLLPDKYTSWLTLSHSSTPDENMIQSWGVGGWLIFLILSIGIVSYFIVRTKKLFPLKKDLRDNEKLEVDVEVTGKNSDTRYDYYYIRVSGGDLKKQKVILTKEQYGNFAEGQKLTIDVYKNSMILVSSSPK